MDAQNLKDALEFINKICSSPNHIIKPFFQAFSYLRNGIWGFEEFNHRISISLSDYPDLLNDFRTFLTVPDWSLQDFNHDFKLWRPFCAKVLGLCTSSDQAAEFLISFYKLSNLDRFDFQNRVEDFLREFPLELDEFRRILYNQLSNTESETPKKKKAKRNLEIELRSEFECFEDPASLYDDDDYLNQINFDSTEVLNLEYNVKQPQEQTLDEQISKEFEDAREELELILFSLSSAIKSLEKLSELGSITDIREHLNDMDLRCINRVYALATKDEMDFIYRNPAKGVNVLLMRLRQKEEELMGIKEGFKNVQSKTGTEAVEYHESGLDFLKSYFCQCVVSVM